MRENRPFHSFLLHWSLGAVFVFPLLLDGPIAKAQLSASIEVTQGLCPGITNANLKVNITGGKAPYTVLWNDGSDTETLSGVGPGTYSVEVTDDLGDQFTAAHTLDELEPFELTFDLQSCESPYTVTAIGSGGTPPYNYKWEHTQQGATVLFLEPGTYCVTLTDNTTGNPCGIQGCVIIPDQSPVSVSVLANDVTCFDAGDGNLEAIPSGGKAPYSYNWSNGATTSSVANQDPGNYTVTVTDDNGCTATASGTIADQPPLTSSTNKTDPSCPGDDDGTASVTAGGGNPPYSINWSNGATTPDINNLAPGVYNVTITDDNGCTITDQVEISTLSSLSISIQANNEQCPGNEDGSLTVNATGGASPLSYDWSTGAKDVSTIVDLPPGTYSVTVTDNLGCSAIGQGVVAAAPDLLISTVSTDVTTCDQDDGTAEVTVDDGVGPFGILWSTGATSAALTGLSSGNYGVTVTDANGCTESSSVNITAPPPISIDLDAGEPICNGASNGSITVDISGGTAPFDIDWNNGATTATIGDLAAGSYTVTVTDINGCSATATTSITEHSAINISVTSDLVVCSGNTGSAAAQVSGGTPPYSYAWSNGATTSSVTGLAEGNHSLTVTDANSCSVTEVITINAAADLEITLTGQDADCYAATTGSITSAVSGGKAPYSYAWSNGATTADLENLTAGSYSVTLTDDNGCTVTVTEVIDEPAELKSGIIGSALLCFGDSDGFATVNPTGGTAPYSVLWSTGAITNTITGLAAGVYSVTITDVNNCSMTASLTLNDPDLLTGSTTVSAVLCAGEATGEITANVSGGNPPYSYAWSNDVSGTGQIDNLLAGTYAVTVTDASNCILILDQIVVSENAALQLDLDVNDITCSSEDEGSITANVSGGTAPYSFQWSNGGSGSTISDLAAGDYTVTVTDFNNCSVTAQATVGQTEDFTISITGVDPDCGTIGNGTAQASVNGGEAPFNYAWSNGGNTSLITGLVAGTYTVTVTDFNGCTGSTQLTLTAEDPFTLDITPTAPLCFGGADGKISVAVNGGDSPFTYNWSNGDNAAKLSDLQAGSYTVTVSDANNCQVVQTVNLQDGVEIIIDGQISHGNCDGTENGSITANISGGSAPYSVFWSNNSIATTISDLSVGDYSVTVTDFNGCTEEATFSILAFDPLNCTITVTELIDSGDDGALRADPVNGVAPYTYEWNTGQTTREITDLSVGSYFVTITDANGCTSSCGFSLIPVTGLGDYVWEDQNYNGVQDGAEPPISGVKVYLKDDLGIILDSTVTDADGLYYFLGLLPGSYSVKFGSVDGYALTEADQGGDDALDSDAMIEMGGMTHAVTLVENQVDSTLDAGFYKLPETRIQSGCQCLSNAYDGGDGHFLEVPSVLSYPNEIWVVADFENAFAENSPDPPMNPTPINIGEVMLENQPGVYTFPIRIVDGIPYSITFTNGISTVTIKSQCTYPDLNLTELVSDDICLTDDPFVLISNPSTPGSVSYIVNDVPLFTIDPEGLGVGEHELVTTLLPTSPEECVTVLRTVFLVTEDCFAKIGDKVWWDKDKDGVQDSSEEGLEGVTITVTSPDDASFIEQVTSDENGMYMIMVPPEQNYKVTFETPVDYFPTLPNIGNDQKDSDIDPMTGMTPVFYVDKNEQNFTLDAGYYKECVNLIDPGKIGFDQVLCGAGNDPDPIVDLQLPTGGEGEIEYLWMKSTSGGVFDPSSWIAIDGSNSPSYDPGPIFRTTYFTRCARRKNCVSYLETNVIGIIVDDQATAEILEPKVICAGDEVLFVADGKGDGDHIQWDFGPSAQPRYVSGNPAAVTYPDDGLYRVILQVTENGCTATDEQRIAVSNSPTLCGSSIAIDLDAMEDGDVMVKWEMESTDLFLYEIEHSKDGGNYEKIGEVETDTNALASNRYEFLDESAKLGFNYYRLRVTDTLGNTAYSEVADIIVYGESRLMMVYPNPVKNELFLEIFDSYDQNVTIEILNANGHRMDIHEIANGEKLEKLNFGDYPAGVYFLRASYGENNVKVLKVLRR